MSARQVPHTLRSTLLSRLTKRQLDCEWLDLRRCLPPRALAGRAHAELLLPHESLTPRLGQRHLIDVPLEALCLAAFRLVLGRYTAQEGAHLGLVRVVDSVAVPLVAAGEPVVAEMLADSAGWLERGRPQVSAQPRVCIRFDGKHGSESEVQLAVSCQRVAAGLMLAANACRSLFDAASLRELLEQLCFVVPQMAAAAANTVLSDLAVVPPPQFEALLEGKELRRHPAEDCIHERVARQASANAQAVAVTCAGSSLTYGELNVRANRLAHYLRRLGARPDSRIAICMERSLDLLVGLLAILKSGAAYVPLDPAYPCERLAFMLTDSRPLTVLTHGPAHSVLRSAMAAQEARTGVPVLAIDAVPAPWAEESEWDGQRADGLTSRHMAYMIYTSGSTGTPKGVMVEHAHVIRLFAATRQGFEFTRADVWTLLHSFAFDFSVWEIWGALMHGARLAVVQQATARDPTALYRLLCDQGVTVLNQTPSAFRSLLGVQGELGGEHRLRYVIFGGEALETAMLAAWYRDTRNREATLVNMYGITETTVHVTYRRLQAADAQQRLSPIGTPIDDLRIYLLDAARRPVPRGVAAEMYIGGAGVARGYWNRPELTHERFLADPFVPGERLYKSGDLARRLPDGGFEFLGRNDFQVKIRGFRIEPGEIEARLCEHSHITEAAVLAREDVPGEKQLVAYYVSRNGGCLDSAAVVAWLRAALPEYMVPSACVQLAALPLTANAKLDRKALPAPSRAAFAARNFVPPEGAIEEQLSELWCGLIGVDRVGRHDEFFALGGHSLLVPKLLTRIQQRFGISLPVAAVLRNPTIAQLAQLLAARNPPAECLAQLRHGDAGRVPLLLVPPIGGSSLCYRELIAALQYPGAVWAYEQNDQVMAAESTHTVQGLAELYVNALLEQREIGGAGVLGWSFGGVVGYEMAVLLERRNRKVSWLGMVDSHPHVQLRGAEIREQALTIFARDLGFSRAQLQELRSGASLDEAVQQLLALAQRRGMLAADTTVAEVTASCRCIESNLERQAVYRPSRWQGNLTYYRAALAESPAADPLAAWRSLGPQLDCSALQADHFGIIRGAHARTLAALVSRRLDEVMPWAQ